MLIIIHSRAVTVFPPLLKDKDRYTKTIHGHENWTVTLKKNKSHVLLKKFSGQYLEVRGQSK
jgi:hypothetical protein